MDSECAKEIWLLNYNQSLEKLINWKRFYHSLCRKKYKKSWFPKRFLLTNTDRNVKI